MAIEGSKSPGGVIDTFKFILRISRPRFWIYTGGTYVIGYTLGASCFTDFLTPAYYLYLIYFFLPVNIFIYGVNDYWDEETDRLNPKKGSMEHMLESFERRKLLILLTAVAVLSAVLMLSQTPEEALIFLGFLFLSYFYSAPPLRFKEKPFLDFSSNYLYIMPGIFGYNLVTGSLPDILLLIAGFCHIAAMHIFSAVPDTEYDSEAGIITTPVFIGRRKALGLSAFFWIILSLLTVHLTDFHPLSFLVFLYPLFPLSVLLSKRIRIERIYWYLPYINTSLGGLLFLALINNRVFHWI